MLPRHVGPARLFTFIHVISVGGENVWKTISVEKKRLFIRTWEEIHTGLFMSSSKNGILIRKAGRCGNERCYFFALASFNFENVFASFGFTVLFAPIACLAWPQKRYMKNETVRKVSGFCGSFLGLHIIWLVDDIKINNNNNNNQTKEQLFISLPKHFSGLLPRGRLLSRDVFGRGQPISTPPSKMERFIDTGRRMENPTGTLLKSVFCGSGTRL